MSKQEHIKKINEMEINSLAKDKAKELLELLYGINLLPNRIDKIINDEAIGFVFRRDLDNRQASIECWDNGEVVFCYFGKNTDCPTVFVEQNNLKSKETRKFLYEIGCFIWQGRDFLKGDPSMPKFQRFLEAVMLFLTGHGWHY